MLNFIYKEKSDESFPMNDILDECNEGKNGIKVNFVPIFEDYSKIPLIAKMQCRNTLVKIQSDVEFNFESGNLFYDNGFSEELSWFILGYLSVFSNNIQILGNDSLRDKYLEIVKRDKVKITDDESAKLFLIRKIIRNKNLPKKINSYLNNTSKSSSVLNYMINGMLVMFGKDPYFVEEDNLFTKSLINYTDDYSR